MKPFARRLMIIAVALLLIPSAFASTLESKKSEIAFDFSYVDTDFLGKTTSLDGSWGYIFGKGHHQVGALVSYLDFSSDDPAVDPDFDAIIIGPIYTFNWTPNNDKVTGFVEAAYGVVSGDAGDVFDSSTFVSVGARIFVGDSAAIRIKYFFQTNDGATGFQDVDNNGLSAGISIFTGGK